MAVELVGFAEANVLVDQVNHVLLFLVVQLGLQTAVAVLQLPHSHSQVRHLDIQLVIDFLLLKLRCLALLFLLQQVGSLLCQVKIQL